MGTIRLQVLGPPSVERDGRPLPPFKSRKVLALLAYLALSPGAHSRSQLAGLLWSDSSEKKALDNLRYALWNVNEVLGEPILQADRLTVSFGHRASIRVDADTFQEAVRDADPSASSGQAPRGRAESPETIAALQRVVDLYRGDLLAGMDLPEDLLLNEWLQQQRATLREMAVTALYRLSAYHTAHRHLPEAIAATRRLLTMDPWREEAHRQMMLLLARSGQRSAALAQYATCRRILVEELGVEPAKQTKALYERIRAAESMRRDNLPPQATPFIGREEELTEITARLANPDCRLLTLVGPGGIGKTRLALQAAAHLAQTGTFLHGVGFVPLAPVNSTEFLVSTIAQSLACSFPGQPDPKVQLLNYLREKEMLLVLDNFEHLLEGAGLLVEILQQAPEVKILVTSRQRLNLQWEWLFQVGGLRYPDFGFSILDFRLNDVVGETGAPQPSTENRKSKIENLQFDAVELFLQTAHRLDVRFSLAKEQPQVVRVCQLVQGMPLGIELAAAWVQVHSCAEIATEIERNLGFLATSLRDVPERHRSLRAVFEHSWKLLSDEERRVFSRLSVFRGGFRAEAAQAILGDECRVTSDETAHTTRVTRHSSLDTLAALVDKSLLRRNPSGRYEFHELLRQYAEEKLAAVPQDQQARDLHCAYYAELLHQREEHLKGGKQKEALEEIGQEIDNVRMGWRRAVEQRKAGEIAKSLESLAIFYETRSWFQEGEEAFGRAAEGLAKFGGIANEPRRETANPFGIDRTVGRVLARQGLCCMRLSDYGKAKDLLQHSLAIFHRLGARADMPFSLNNLGNVASRLGEYAEAKQLFKESLAISRELGDPSGIARALNNLGFTVHLQGEDTEAQQLLEEGLAIRRQIDDRAGIAKSLINLALVVQALGEYEEAKQLYRQSLAVFQELNDQAGIAICLNNLGYRAYKQEQYTEARELHQQSLAIRRELGDQWGIALSLDNLGAAACAVGEYQESETYFRQALEVAREIRAVRKIVDVLVGIATLLAKEGKPERAVELLALCLRHPAISNESKDPGQRLLAELESQLAPNVVAAAVEKGRARKLEEVVEELTNS